MWFDMYRQRDLRVQDYATYAGRVSMLVKLLATGGTKPEWALAQLAEADAALHSSAATQGLLPPLDPAQSDRGGVARDHSPKGDS